MTQEEKAQAYDNYIREGDRLQREISRLKSQYPITMPDNEQKIIENNQKKLNELQVKLQNLLKYIVNINLQV